MTRAETTYTLDNTWERAHQRLTLLESLLDQSTISRLASLGVDAGWRCLELGAGAGSIARWLCNAVGATGMVT
ncbi:MAG TPA: SAM-dependent methyltransferase, partial [Acidimicrobiia bacterium]|nr:SAM-dependent methyltransferase [Acidimicrobiia bacterium]